LSIFNTLFSFKVSGFQDTEFKSQRVKEVEWIELIIEIDGIDRIDRIDEVSGFRFQGFRVSRVQEFKGSSVSHCTFLPAAQQAGTFDFCPLTFYLRFTTKIF
jgi:hypothetical protein